MMKCNIAQLINSSKEISLDGYCEATIQKGILASLKRNSFNNAGVGQAKYIYAKNKYAIFNSKVCPYAALLIEGGRVFKLACKLTNQEHKKLEK